MIKKMMMIYVIQIKKSIVEIEISGRKLQAILDSTMTGSTKIISKYIVK